MDNLSEYYRSEKYRKNLEKTIKNDDIFFKSIDKFTLEKFIGDLISEYICEDIDDLIKDYENLFEGRNNSNMKQKQIKTLCELYTDTNYEKLKQKNPNLSIIKVILHVECNSCEAKGTSNLFISIPSRFENDLCKFNLKNTENIQTPLIYYQLLRNEKIINDYYFWRFKGLNINKYCLCDIENFNENVNDYFCFEYTDRTITCFTGDCTIMCPINNIPRFIRDLEVGDLVYTTDNKITKIRAILETRLTTTHTMLQKNKNGLKITNYHPVQNEKGEWIFPCESDEYTAIFEQVSSVYSIALRSGHVLYINDTPVIGLAHNFSDNAIVKHPYFGSNRVIESIYTINPKGHATLTDKQLHRNSQTGLIDGIIV